MNLPSTVLLVIGAASTAVGSVLLIATMVVHLGTSKFRLSVPVFAAAIIAFVASATIGLTSSPGNPRDLVASTYGVQLDEGQVKDLRWPSGAPGTDDTIFGTTTVLGADRTPVTIHLLWDGSQLILVDDAGVELPRMGS